MRRDLDIRPLRTLVTIVDTGGFRRAAEALNISQPAVSQHIRRLDALIGEPVFRDAGQSLTLGTVGEELLRHARQLVRANDELILRLSAQLRPQRLALGVCDALVGVTPALLRGLKEKALHGLTVRTGPADELTDQLAEGALDVVLKLGRPQSPTDRVIGAITCGWFGHRCLLRTNPLPVAVFGSRSAPLRRLAEDTLNSAALPWQVVYQGASVEDVATVSQSGIGVSLLFAAQRSLDLPPFPPGILPNPVRRLTAVLAVGSRVTEEVAQVTLAVARDVIEQYTLPAPTAVLTPDLRPVDV